MRRTTRRRFLAGLGALALGAGCAPLAGRTAPSGPPSADPKDAPTSTPDVDLEALAQNVVSGGPPKDGIPAIEEPQFVSASELDGLLKPDDAVFVLSFGGEVRVYPQIILVWHEIVNDVVGGEKLSVTYCPLTGSVVAFRGRSPAGEPLTFGTSGKLVNSNLLMYDRQTDSRWPQILGRAISGPMLGATLEEVPLVWTTWELWKGQGLDAPVLSARTGHARAYGRDPYGSYSSPRGGYYVADGLYFPVTARDERFPPKHVVVGVRVGDLRLAVPKRVALEKGAWNLEVGGEPLAVVRDPELEAAWVFSRRLGDQVLELQPAEESLVVDGQGRVWRRSGASLHGPAGEVLPAVPFYDVMWFAWYAFYPRTEVAG